MPSLARLTLSEAEHTEALAAAQAQHRRVRESALLAVRNNELQLREEELRRLENQQLERIRLEQDQADLAAKVQELQRKTIPLPPPRSPSPPPPAPTPKQTPAPPRRRINGGELPPTSHHSGASQLLPESLSSRGQGLVQKSPAAAEPAATRPQSPKPSLSTPKQAVVLKSIAASTHTVPVATRPPGALEHSSLLPGAAKYLEIHKRLKQLRRFMTENAKRNPDLKKKMGEMRRGIRRSVGQLTEGRGANRTPMKAIVDILKEALDPTYSGGLDPNMMVLKSPAPVEGASNNGPSLPSLFLYCLNIFAKAVISQFIDEAGVSPKAADPIGVIAVSIFSNPELTWRKVSLIDILIAKFRVVCPVLFGIRGSESTEEGRARLGWRRDGENGDWVSEQVHSTRMTGLGAGYASISLRDFSRSQNNNPFPPTNYWRSFASIVNTPPDQASSTQYTVLKAMIENYEQRFMSFYGSAARAALQVALVDFPAQAKESTVAVSSLKVLADKLRRDMGLELRPSSSH